MGDALTSDNSLGNKTSNYLISLDTKNPKAKGDMYVGKVRATDSKKNQYFVFDDGKNPQECSSQDKWRSTLMGINFSSQKMKSIGNIRTTNIYMHKVSHNEWDASNPHSDRLKYASASEIFNDDTAIVVCDK